MNREIRETNADGREYVERPPETLDWLELPAGQAANERRDIGVDRVARQAADDPRRQDIPLLTTTVDGTRDLQSGCEGPSPLAQMRLENALPKEADGGYRAFASPEMIVGLINQGDIARDGPSEDLVRRNNCVDCSMSMISTWYGGPEVSAPSGDPQSRGETMERAEQWAGASAGFYGTGAEALDRVGRRVQDAGPGACAMIGVEWVLDPDRGHAFTVHNVEGQLVWCDPQWAVAQRERLYGDGDDAVGRVLSIVLDPEGKMAG